MRAILAAWTALEALSPQSYKRPEDMVSGDRSRLLLLERGVLWGPEVRSKPSHKLYFEVVLSHRPGQGHRRVGQGVRRG